MLPARVSAYVAAWGPDPLTWEGSTCVQITLILLTDDALAQE